LDGHIGNMGGKKVGRKRVVHTKKFSGENFRFDNWYKFKTDAKKRAKSLRQGKGVKARVVPNTKLGKWIVYVRRT
jgi:hypothetical protein